MLHSRRAEHRAGGFIHVSEIHGTDAGSSGLTGPTRIPLLISDLPTATRGRSYGRSAVRPMWCRTPSQVPNTSSSACVPLIISGSRGTSQAGIAAAAMSRSAPAAPSGEFITSAAKASRGRHGPPGRAASPHAPRALLSRPRHHGAWGPPFAGVGRADGGGQGRGQGLPAGRDASRPTGRKSGKASVATGTGKGALPTASLKTMHFWLAVLRDASSSLRARFAALYLGLTWPDSAL
jgi:hypothetical protein